MKKRICALLLAAVLVYMPYALAAAILTPLNHPAAQGTAWAAYEQEAAAQTPGAQRVRVLEHSDEALLWRLRLIGSAREEIIFSSFDLRADESGQDVMAALREAAARGVEAFVVGLPRNMDGSEGESAAAARGFAEALSRRSGLSAALWDERLTTVSAHNALNQTDTRGKKRKAVVDTVAATMILQNYLDYRRNHPEQL